MKNLNLTQQDRERLAESFVRFLDSGELDGLERIYKIAASDAKLDAMLADIHVGYEQEERISFAPQSPTSIGEAAPSLDVNIARRDPHLPFRRGILAAELVYQQYRDRRFGRVKLMKQLHFIEQLAELSLSSNIQRAVAGPFDNKMMRSVDSQLKQRGIEKSPDGKWPIYHVSAKADKHDDYYWRYWGTIDNIVRRVIDLTRTLDTYHISIVATLYDAWQSLIEKDDSVDDDRIVYEATVNWHEEKKAIPKHDWLWGLDWMRQNNFMPNK